MLHEGLSIKLKAEEVQTQCNVTLHIHCLFYLFLVDLMSYQRLRIYSIKTIARLNKAY